MSESPREVWLAFALDGMLLRDFIMRDQRSVNDFNQFTNFDKTSPDPTRYTLADPAEARIAELEVEKAELVEALRQALDLKLWKGEDANKRSKPLATWAKYEVAKP